MLIFGQKTSNSLGKRMGEFPALLPLFKKELLIKERQERFALGHKKEDKLF